MTDLIILVPVFNDSESLEKLCKSKFFQESSGYSFEMIIVNDGSANFHLQPTQYQFPIATIHLHTNLGHQKALAIGLAYVYHNKKASHILVMDADGEDDPQDISVLLERSLRSPEDIVFAKRTGRKEGLVFRTGYHFYKILFHLLTGHTINFGNFMLIPFRYLDKLIYKNDIWNHLAAGIIKSKLPHTSVPVARKKRLAGTSKMNISRLILHGLGAISVFVDYLSTRLLIVSSFLLVITALGIFAIIFIKAFTNLAIPGWASTFTGVMMIIFLQSFLISLVTLIFYLSSQSQRHLIPGIHYNEFISSVSVS